MHIRLETDGGFVVIPGLHPPIEVDVSELPQATGARIRALLTQADFFELPELLPPPPQAADVRMYKLTVEDGDRVHTVRFSELNSSPELRELVTILRS